MNKFINIAFLIFLNTPLLADITYTSNNCSVTASNPELNLYVFEITDTGTIQGSVLFEGDDADDRLRVIVKDNPNREDSIRINIYEGNDNRTNIGAVELIQLVNPDEDMLHVGEVRVTGSIGISGQPAMGIRASELRYIDIGGSIYSDIYIDKQDHAGGDIKQILVDGMIDGGSILNAEGDIGFCWIAEGVSGDLANVEIWARGSIDALQCLGDFDGRIGESDNSGLSGQPADIGSVHIGGDFIHQVPMTFRTLFGNFAVVGDYEVSITLQNPLQNNILFAIGGTIIENPLDPAAFINVPADGLKGQVVINFQNGMSTWPGSDQITVGSTPLEEGYSTLSAELGGGQAGLVPFNFHQRATAPNINPATGLEFERDCDPYHTEVLTIEYQNPLNLLDEVVLEHYGPVYVVNDGEDPAPGEHFHVEFYPDYQTMNPQWYDRSDQFVVDSYSENPLGTSTRITLKKEDPAGTGFVASGHWRITPKDDKVKCAIVPNNPKVLYRSAYSAIPVDSTTTSLDWYRFRVRQLSPSQMVLLDSGNGPQASDLSQWLIAPYETNADGDIDEEDFIDMAANMDDE